jgi:hypothetical protein
MKRKQEYFIRYNYLNDRIVLIVSQRGKASNHYLLNFIHKKRLSKLEYYYGGSSEEIVVFPLNNSPEDNNLDNKKGKFSMEFLSFKQFNNPTHPHAEVFDVLRKTKLFNSHQG